ncbi:MAG: hypothetical protein WAN12_21130 [Candidatus Acidiferrum sp.]
MSIDRQGMRLNTHTLATGHDRRQLDGDPQDDALASAPIACLH